MKHLRLISILFVWTGIYWLIKSHGLDKTKTVSKHAALNAKYHGIFAAIEIITTILFVIFMFGWFIPEHSLSFKFSTATIGASFGLVLAAIVPDRPGLQSKIHGAGAYGMALLFLIMQIIFLLEVDSINLTVKTLFITSTIFMIIGWAAALFKVDFYKSHNFAFQVAYLASFDICTLAATYLI